MALATATIMGAVSVFAGCSSSVGAARVHTDAVPIARQQPAETTVTPPPSRWPRPGWVSVAVATVWNQPDLVRPVDAPAVAPSPAVGRWLSGLSYDQRLDLDNRLATQALLDDPVTVESEAGGWAHVLVDEQRGAVYRSGIAGWVPVAQITFVPPPVTGLTAVVTQPLVPAGGITLSYGTRLPVASASAAGLVVRTPAGAVALPTADAELGTAPATGARVVTEARRFLGLPYLWAGTSGFGLDCSGLTYMAYRQLGITLPRDAADQAAGGQPVAKADLRPGDLVFFAFGPGIDHVGIYAGNGLMIDSPDTGGRVEVVNLWTPSLASAYAGGRRYLSDPD